MQTIFRLIVAISVVAVPAAGYSATLVDEGRTKVEAGAAVKAEFVAQDADETVDEVGARITGARLYARGTHHDFGKVFVQTEHVNEVSVLDAYGEISYFDPISLRMGVFWVPFMREIAIGYTDLSTPGRTLVLGALAPGRRAGVNLAGDFDLGPVALRVDAGIFNPRPGVGNPDPGAIINERIRASFDFGLHVQVAYVQHILDDNANPSTGTAVYPIDKALNVALHYEKDGIRLLADAVMSFDGPGDTKPFGIYGLAAYKIGGEPGEFGYEPAVSVDFIDSDNDSTLTRVQGNLAWLVVGRNLQLRATYGAEIVTDVDTGHVGTLQMQGAF